MSWHSDSIERADTRRVAPDPRAWVRWLAFLEAVVTFPLRVIGIVIVVPLFVHLSEGRIRTRCGEVADWLAYGGGTFGREPTR